MKKINIFSKKLVHQSIFSVFETKFSFIKNNGKKSKTHTHWVVEKGPAVAILVYDITHEEIVLVKQLRTATQTVITEVVAGVMDPGESPEMSARREILEEVGYNVKQLNLIYSFYTTPGIFNETIHFFYTEVTDEMKVNEGGGLAEEEEDLEIIRIPKAEIIDWLAKEKELDAKTIIGIQYFINHKI